MAVESVRILVSGLGILLASAALAGGSAYQSYVYVVRQSGQSGISDPVALSVRAKKSIALLERQPKQAATTIRLAKSALKQQALSPSALAAQALAVFTESQQDQSRKLLRTSQRASRRELLAHFADIEHYVGKNDAAGALQSYDLALTTSADASQILFPILANALEDDSIRKGLQTYIKRGVSWIDPFVYHVIRTGNGLEFIGQALLDADSPQMPEKRKQLTNDLMYALIGKGYYGQARQSFVRGNADKAKLLVSAELKPENFDKSSGGFGWQLTETTDFGAKRSGNGTLEIFAAANIRGIVASKILFLPPGNYGLSVTTLLPSSTTIAPAKWSLQCHNLAPSPAYKAPAEIEYPVSSNRQSLIRVIIPGNCPVQNLKLLAIGADSQLGTEFSIKSVTLRDQL